MKIPKIKKKIKRNQELKKMKKSKNRKNRKNQKQSKNKKNEKTIKNQKIKKRLKNDILQINFTRNRAAIEAKHKKKTLKKTGTLNVALRPSGVLLVSSFFLSIFCHCWHLYLGLTKDVSPAVDAPWRCSVLKTQAGIAGIGLGHPLGREHDTTLQSGVEAPQVLKTEPPQIGSLLLFCGGERRKGGKGGEERRKAV